VTKILAETDSNKVPNWAAPGNVVRCKVGGEWWFRWFLYDSDGSLRPQKGPGLNDRCTIERVIADPRDLPPHLQGSARNERGMILLVLKEWPIRLSNGEDGGWSIDCFEPVTDQQVV
jgi:hypothetical protein